MGIRLSLIVQILQIPKITIVYFSYSFFLGFELSLATEWPPFHNNFVFIDYFDSEFLFRVANEVQRLMLGVNLVGLACFGYLLKGLRRPLSKREVRVG
jgi:hypothetical protein